MNAPLVNMTKRPDTPLGNVRSEIAIKLSYSKLGVFFAYGIVSEYIVPDLLHGSESHAHVTVSAAVVNGDTTSRRVGQGGAGEAHIRHEAPFLVPFLRCQQIILAAVEYLRGLVYVEDSRADTVNVAVAGVHDTVVEQQPALVGLNRSSASAYLEVFPPVAAASHNVAVVSPKFHVLALGEKNVPESGVTVVAGTGEHNVIFAYLTREENCVPVVWEKRVLKTGEGLEIGGFSYSDSGAVGVLTPHYIVCIVYLYETRIIGVRRHKGSSGLVGKGNLIRFKFPVECVLAPSEINVRDAVPLFASEHADVSAFVGHYCAVEDTCHVGERVPVDDRVFGIPPDRSGTGLGLVLPRHTGKSRTN